MEEWATQVLSGITYGGLLFILASGFTLGLGIMKIVNIAHGALYLLTAYIAWSVYQATNSFLLVIAVCCAIGGIVALAMYAGLLQRTAATSRPDLGHDGCDPDHRRVRRDLVGRLPPHGGAT